VDSLKTGVFRDKLTSLQDNQKSKLAVVAQTAVQLNFYCLHYSQSIEHASRRASSHYKTTINLLWQTCLEKGDYACIR